MDPAAPCIHLEWDSEFFGRRIARVAVPTLTRGEIQRVHAWSRSEAVDCLYYLVDAADTQSILNAQDAGFRLVDTRVTLSRRLEGHEASAEEPLPRDVEVWSERDLPALRAIARASHTASRFYHDPHFPRALCGALYERWIEANCTGRADEVFVCRKDGEAAGYITCHLDPDEAGSIGLFALADPARGRGLGQCLLQAFLRWLAGQGKERARVVTQARNVRALRSFEKAGFLTSSVQHWHHWWRPEAATGTPQ